MLSSHADSTIRDVRFEQPSWQAIQDPQPRTEATSNAVMSQNYSFPQQKPPEQCSSAGSRTCLRFDRPMPSQTRADRGRTTGLLQRRRALGHYGVKCGAPRVMQFGGRSPNLCIGGWKWLHQRIYGPKCAADCTLLDWFSFTLRP